MRGRKREGEWRRREEERRGRRLHGGPSQENLVAVPSSAGHSLDELLGSNSRSARSHPQVVPGRKLQPRRAVTRRGETKGGSAPPSPRPIRTGRDVETASGRRGLHRGAGEPGRARVRSGSQRAAPDPPITYTNGDPFKKGPGRAPCGWARNGTRTRTPPPDCADYCEVLPEYRRLVRARVDNGLPAPHYTRQQLRRKSEAAAGTE